MIANLDRILNKEQYEAATAGDGPLLVLAAAGTGKTQTLVYRVAHLIDQGVDPSSILLLTFTNKAANEMLERATQVVGAEVNAIWSGTFHSICNRILRHNAYLLGYSNSFVIADRDDSRKLIERAMKEVGVGGDNFPKKDVLASYFSNASNRDISLEQVLSERLSGLKDFGADVERVYDVYTRIKKEDSIMDFDDLLLNGVKLLETQPQVLEYYQRRFKYILVDEYQDTNSVQSRFVDMLAAHYKNIMAVGDDFQCIYTWRGADFRNIMDFPNRYPGSRVIKLEQNYRSTPEILDVANACIACNTEQFQKTLRATYPHGERPAVHFVYNGFEQSATIISLIGHYRNIGYRYSDMAVLYRGHFHSIDLQAALTKSRIPFRITSGVGIYETVHAKDLISLFRIMTNSADRLAFERFFQIYPGMGAATITKLWKKLGGVCHLDTPEGRAELEASLKPAVRALFSPLSKAIEKYYEVLQSKESEEVNLVSNAFLDSFYADYLRKHFDNADERIDDINAVVAQIQESESLVSFLEDVALITNIESETQGDMANVNGIRLSTIHQAKGLEWPIVFILWCCEEMFPSAKAIKENDDDSEERRLFYVAVTRAKNSLNLFAPSIRMMPDHSIMPCRPSRFVKEIPTKLLSLRRGY